MSFRDPHGRLFIQDGRVIRAVYAPGVDHIGPRLASPRATKLVASGKLVTTNTLTLDHVAGILPENILQHTALVVEHNKIPFPSYPY